MENGIALIGSTIVDEVLPVVEPGRLTYVDAASFVPEDELLGRFHDQAAAGLGPDLLLGISPAMIRRYPFAAGSMGPKVEAACAFVEQTGGIAGIGGLSDAQAILAGRAGTLVAPDASAITWWE